METTQKFRILKSSAKYDVCTSSNPRSEMHRSSSSFSKLALNRNEVSGLGLGGIYQASTPHACTSLFKVLLSNKCQHNCGYCENAKDNNIARASLAPEEMAAAFNELHRTRMVQGLFLSSAVEDTPERTMAKIIKTAEIVRYKYNFNGFIHLKIMPGASEAAISQACKLASRASINMEAPTASHLSCLSHTKNFKDITRTIEIISKQIHKNMLPSGQTTQFVVGASGEKDENIIQTSEDLYHSHPMRRIYFSAFSPIKGTALENVRRADPLRQHRLYQCDFLMREYGFKSSELVYTPQGQLPLDSDPKINFALNHPELYPVEINRAPIDLLLKVPGIGPKAAERIARIRQVEPFRELRNLKGIGATLNRAKDFILINGKKQGLLKKKLEATQLAFGFSMN